MKKIVIVIALSMISLMTFAQRLVSFGPKVGWNCNQLTTDYAQYIKDCKSGWQGGAFFSIYVHKFYIQPEVYFSIKAGEIQTSIGNTLDPGSTLNVRQTINLQSIDVPLLLGYQVLDLKLAKVRVWGGPAVSYFLDKEYTLTNSDTGASINDPLTKDDFKNGSWSVQLGAGLDIFMLTFDIGYEMGLDSFLKNPSVDDFNPHNNLFYCSIGWRLF